MKLFLDTSILSAYFDISKPLRQLVTVKWIKNNISAYDIFVSDLILQEIENNTNQDLKDKMFTLLDSISPVVIEIEEDVLDLENHYHTLEIVSIENLGGDSYGNI